MLAVLPLVGISVSLFFGPSGWFLVVGLMARAAVLTATGLVTRLTGGSIPTERQRDAAAGLAALWGTVGGRRSVGPLPELTCFWVPGTSIADAAVAALRRLLPRLQAADAGLLGEQQQQALIGLAQKAWQEHRGAWWGARGHPRAFCVEALHAVGALRLVAAIPALRKLARLRQRTENHRRVREAARECLNALEAADRGGL